MKIFKFLFNSSKSHHSYIWGMIITMMVIAIDGTIKPFLIKIFIDSAVTKSNNLWYILGLYIITQFILIVSWALNQYFSTKFSANSRFEPIEDFVKHLYNYSYNFYQNHQTGNIISKVNDVLILTIKLIFIAVNNFLSFFFITIFALLILFTVSKLFAIALLIWLCLFLSVTFFAYRKSKIINQNYAEERAKISGAISDYITNILSVKLFVRRDFELQNLQKLKEDFQNIILMQGFYFIKLYLLQGILTALYVIGFFVFLIKGYYHNIITPGDIALVVMINVNIISNIYPLINIAKEFVADWGAIDNAMSMFENLPEIEDKHNSSLLKIKNGKIIFNKINFSYPNCEALFYNQSITIKAKQKIGLVGFSGSGKSTFINLLLRFYDLKGGQISIDEQDISKVTQDSLRENIAMIPQDPNLFHRSLLENIRYGKIDSSDEEVIEAAKTAHADEFISKLPQGYNTLVGERGIKLSGGQRQRISIARAILKDAPILILDEATSQLDSLTESYIQKSILKLMNNKTTIVIAHRLSTLLHMDRILVFNQGYIVQDGSHDELLLQDGLYKDMWNAQVGGFLPQNNIEESDNNNIKAS